MHLLTCSDFLLQLEMSTPVNKGLITFLQRAAMLALQALY